MAWALAVSHQGYGRSLTLGLPAQKTSCVQLLSKALLWFWIELLQCVRNNREGTWGKIWTFLDRNNPLFLPQPFKTV